MECGDDFLGRITCDEDEELLRYIFEEVKKRIFRFLFTRSAESIDITEKCHEEISGWFLIEFFYMFFYYFYLVVLGSPVTSIGTIIVHKIRDSSVFYFIEGIDFFSKQEATDFRSKTFRYEERSTLSSRFESLNFI